MLLSAFRSPVYTDRDQKNTDRLFALLLGFTSMHRRMHARDTILQSGTHAAFCILPTSRPSPEDARNGEDRSSRHPLRSPQPLMTPTASCTRSRLSRTPTRAQPESHSQNRHLAGVPSPASPSPGHDVAHLRLRQTQGLVPFRADCCHDIVDMRVRRGNVRYYSVFAELRWCWVQWLFQRHHDPTSA